MGTSLTDCLLVLVLVLVCSVPSVLRASFLGDEEHLPEAALAGCDVEARWSLAANERQLSSGGSGSSRGSFRGSTSSRASRRANPVADVNREGGGASASPRRRPKGRDSTLAVMFRNAHVRELLPTDFQTGAHQIGTGTYSTVYKAT